MIVYKCFTWSWKTIATWHSVTFALHDDVITVAGVAIGLTVAL